MDNKLIGKIMFGVVEKISPSAGVVLHHLIAATKGEYGRMRVFRTEEGVPLFELPHKKIYSALELPSKTYYHIITLLEAEGILSKVDIDGIKTHFFNFEELLRYGKDEKDTTNHI